MVTSHIHGGVFARLYYTWRSYRFPWRRRYFIGMDLRGNTFWEYRDRIHAHRPRRMVQPHDTSLSWLDSAAELSPVWIQWLRVARNEAPSIAEQHQDVMRLAALQRGAALADARWNAKPSLLNTGPHPPPNSVLESNTKFSNDSGLQRRQDIGRGEVGADLEGGKSAEKVTVAGEETGNRAHGLRKSADDPWADASRKSEEGFKHNEWDPNSMLPRGRGSS